MLWREEADLEPRTWFHVAALLHSGCVPVGKPLTSLYQYLCCKMGISMITYRVIVWLK